MTEHKLGEDLAIIRSSKAPSDVQVKRFTEFLSKKYGHPVTLKWEEEASLENGFRLTIGDEVFDWSVEGRLQQFKNKLETLNLDNTDEQNIIPLFQETVRDFTPEIYPEEVGTVLSVGDGIATVSGLDHVTYGEILLFTSGVKGMVQDLKRGEVGCVLFGSDEEITEGSFVRRTGKTAGIPVGDEFLGRVVDALGTPIDGKGEIPAVGYRPIEMPALPAPLITSLMSPMFLPTTLSALMSAAAQTIAVPCWSSWKTGISQISLSLRSISKQRGALMSSRLMPPNEPLMLATVSTNSSTLSAWTQSGNASTSPNDLNSAHLPSITGMPASGPMLPRPSTAVPSVMTATRLLRRV